MPPVARQQRRPVSGRFGALPRRHSGLPASGLDSMKNTKGEQEEHAVFAIVERQDMHRRHPVSEVRSRNECERPKVSRKERKEDRNEASILSCQESKTLKRVTKTIPWPTS